MRTVLFWVITQWVVVGCPKGMVRNYHYSLHNSPVLTNRGLKSSMPQGWGCRGHVNLAIIFYCPGISILKLAVQHGHVHGGLEETNICISYPHSSSYQKIMLNSCKILHCKLCYNPSTSTECISTKASRLHNVTILTHNPHTLLQDLMCGPQTMDLVST